MKREGVITYYAKNRTDWRAWLIANHLSEDSVWLIIYKKSSATNSVTYKEAIAEALCFGWIDSKPNKRDEESYFQYFSKRNPKSNWSKVNKDLIAVLDKEGLVYPQGKAMVNLAKKTGTWDALNDVDLLIIPEDLLQAFTNHPGAKEYFEAFPRSVRRGILEWIHNAKTATTRQKRITETATLAAKNIRANQYRK